MYFITGGEGKSRLKKRKPGTIEMEQRRRITLDIHEIQKSSRNGLLEIILKTGSGTHMQI